MIKQRAIEIVQELISTYRSEYEGTEEFENDIEEIYQAEKYIIRKLNEK